MREREREIEKKKETEREESEKVNERREWKYEKEKESNYERVKNFCAVKRKWVIHLFSNKTLLRNINPVFSHWQLSLN